MSLLKRQQLGPRAYGNFESAGQSNEEVDRIRFFALSFAACWGAESYHKVYLVRDPCHQTDFSLQLGIPSQVKRKTYQCEKTEAQ